MLEEKHEEDVFKMENQTKFLSVKSRKCAHGSQKRGIVGKPGEI